MGDCDTFCNAFSNSDCVVDYHDVYWFRSINMISMVTGLPGASKSYDCAVKAHEFLLRNRKWYQQTGIKRTVRSNLVFDDLYTQEMNDTRDLPVKLAKGIKLSRAREEHNMHHDFLEYWDDPEELPTMSNCDVIWEEMGAHVDSRSWEQLPFELRRWLQQHRHRGVEIYGNCQDFADIDTAVRRLVGRLFHVKKLAGSRDPSPTTPPPRRVWGLVVKRRLDVRKYDSADKFKGSTWEGFYTLKQEVVRRYSMFNDIEQAKPPPLRHTQRECLDCGKLVVTHK